MYNPTKQAELDAVVCNASTTIPPPGNFNLTLSTDDRVVGISIDGALIFNTLDSENEDIFYPTTYASPESVDIYFGEINYDGIYHYSLGSSCPLDPPVLNPITVCNNVSINASFADYITCMFTNHKKLTVIGIATDEHLIYGPYTSDGVLITHGFDICNGMFFDAIGNYGYFATSTLPYIIGCFGPGNYPDKLLPNCTSNPTEHYMKSSYPEGLCNGNNGGLMITFNLIGITMTILTLIENYN